VTPDFGEWERATEAVPVSPSLLASIIGDQSTHPVIVDIRHREAYCRRHLQTAVSIPWGGLPRSLFLLPPRPRPILVVAHSAAVAQEAGTFLASRGWTQVAWLNASMGDPGLQLPPNLWQAGPFPNRVWEPAPLLQEYASHLPQHGDAIDLACGSGRECAFLALRRSRVLGVDLLPDALRQARTLARAACVAPGNLSLRRFDLTDAVVVESLLRPHRFQLITCFRYLDRALLPAIATALATGGWLIYQTFIEAQAQAGRKPMRPEYLLRPGELRQVFETANRIEIVHYAEGPDVRGDHMASLVARRLS
jgi:tellurite methyltransferase